MENENKEKVVRVRQRSLKKMAVPKGMFAIAFPFSRRDDPILVSWERHFKKKKIKTEVVKHAGIYSLCREGREALCVASVRNHARKQ